MAVAGRMREVIAGAQQPVEVGHPAVEALPADELQRRLVRAVKQEPHIDVWNCIAGTKFS